MAGPQYTVKDLVYYAGLFGGIILVYIGTEPLGLHQIVRLIGGLVAGVALGWVALKIYEGPSYRDDDDQDPF